MLVDRLGSAGIIADECPISLALNDAVRRKQCQDITSILPKNKAYCCAIKCEDKSRLCPSCVSQGEVRGKRNSEECRTTDPETGLCKWHLKYGKDSRKEHKPISEEAEMERDYSVDSDLEELNRLAEELADGNEGAKLVFCEMLGKEVPSVFCETRSGKQAVYKNYCSKIDCDSPFRVCTICVRQGYVYTDRAKKKKDFFSIKPERGLCKDHIINPLHEKGSGKPNILIQKPEKVPKPKPAPKKRLTADQIIDVGEMIIRRLEKGESPENIKKDLGLEKQTCIYYQFIGIVVASEIVQDAFRAGKIDGNSAYRLSSLREQDQEVFMRRVIAVYGDEKKLEKIMKEIKVAKKAAGPKAHRSFKRKAEASTAASM